MTSKVFSTTKIADYKLEVEAFFVTESHSGDLQIAQGHRLNRCYRNPQPGWWNAPKQLHLLHYSPQGSSEGR